MASCGGARDLAQITSRHTWVALPALLDRVRPVDVRFQINVHRVSVWAVKPPTPEQPPTPSPFWDKYGVWITVGGLFALGVLINWITDAIP